MTRAKDELNLLVPQRFYVHQQSGMGDCHVCALRSRFIPEAILPQLEERTWPPACTSESSSDGNAGASVRVDLAAKMKALWR